jgi:hypothetical protein
VSRLLTRKDDDREAPRALPGLPGEREGDNPSQNQVHNEAIFADSYAGISYGRPFVASVSGLCPLCTSYIARGRSKIVRLSEPVPVYEPAPYCVSRGWFWGGNSRMFPTTWRQYAHLRCAAKSCAS